MTRLKQRHDVQNNKYRHKENSDQKEFFLFIAMSLIIDLREALSKPGHFNPAKLAMRFYVFGNSDNVCSAFTRLNRLKRLELR
jgi:hypothetical protein